MSREEVLYCAADSQCQPYSSRAKDIIGDVMCICGNVPVSLLRAGTAEEIKDYCKKQIDVVGRGGGFIMSTRSVLDDAKPENVRIMFDFTKRYGVYG